MKREWTASEAAALTDAEWDRLRGELTGSQWIFLRMFALRFKQSEPRQRVAPDGSVVTCVSSVVTTETEEGRRYVEAALRAQRLQQARTGRRGTRRPLTPRRPARVTRAGRQTVQGRRRTTRTAAASRSGPDDGGGGDPPPPRTR